MNTTLVWFRRDLRLNHNPALEWACQNSKRIIPVYIHAPEEDAPWQAGGASRWWLDRSLRALNSELQQYGLTLQCFSGNSQAILSDIIRTTGARALVFNRLYEPHLYQRDEAILEQHGKQAFDVRAFDVGLLFKPGSVLNNQGLPYRVYTPFSKKIQGLLQLDPVSASRHRPVIKTADTPPLAHACSIDELALNDPHDWHAKLHHYWQPGEQHALQRLDEFVEHRLADYDVQRDIPSMDGSSALSAHLHFGEITVEQIYTELMPWLDGQYGAQAQSSARRYLNQLIWREFAHHILWHYPHTATLPMDARYTARFWKKPGKHFKSWTRGETGVPIIDAGMKQLWETGWMHNRVRMIAASWLCKNLGYHWLEGARWFWDTLVDADLANNSMGWQWVAGCGVDAAPYYRIFNPLSQTRRFDPQLNYIRQWAPQALELNYRAPIVDPGASRQQALHRYKLFFTNPRSLL